ncbi:MAG: ABC transporter permease subunit [Bifidobacteriaceae bacterium]|jgi:ABC-type glycerol-3-phosphate transport system permease component|nr:ABC transporter permease subunit [Bifidobacteriaceae bacterium]
MLQSVYAAMTKWSGFSKDRQFVGFANFLELLRDDYFLNALGNSATLAVVVPTATLLVAFGIAVAITSGGPLKGQIRGVRGSSFYRVVTFFPFCIPAVIVGVVWGRVFDPGGGLLNGALTALGFDSFQDFPWLGRAATAMPAAMFVIVWSQVGFYTILFVAAIKAVPAECYEAARLDGAGRLRTAFQVTLPQITGSLRTGYIYMGFIAMDAFVFMQAMFPAGTSPEYSTVTLTQDLYATAFTKGNFGYAASMGVCLALIMLVYAGAVAAVFRLIGASERTTWLDRRRLRRRPTGHGRSWWPAGARIRRGKVRARWQTKAAELSTASVFQILLIAWSALTVGPFLWTIISSFKTTKEFLGSPMALPGQLNWDNYARAWNDAGIGQFFFNTVVVVGGALAIVMTLGSLCAYALARIPFPGAKAIYSVMLASMTLPVFLAIVPLFFVLRGLDLLNTKTGLMLTYSAFALPFTVFFLYAFFKALPNDQYEAAVIDGAGEWRAFFHVMLPLAARGIGTVAMFNFLGLWNQFILPLVLNTKRENYVLMQGMATYSIRAGYATDFGAMFAAIVLTVLPVVLVYVFFQRQLAGVAEKSFAQ